MNSSRHKWDPHQLSKSERKVAAKARMREAKRLKRQERKAMALYEKMRSGK